MKGLQHRSERMNTATVRCCCVSIVNFPIASSSICFPVRWRCAASSADDAPIPLGSLVQKFDGESRCPFSVRFKFHRHYRALAMGALWRVLLMVLMLAVAVVRGNGIVEQCPETYRRVDGVCVPAVRSSDRSTGGCGADQSHAASSSHGCKFPRI